MSMHKAAGSAGSQIVSYHPALDGVRAICIIFTVANHLPHMPAFINGTVGVDIFFALSGWLITWLLMSERESTGSISLRSFYIRRAFRILPLYYVTVLLYGIAAVASIYVKHDRSDMGDYINSFWFMVSMNSEYKPDASGNIFGQSWTIGIEEKFYILWPFLLVLSARWPRVSTVLAVVCPVALIAMGEGTSYLLRGYVGLGFGAGFAVAAFHAEKVRVFLLHRVTPYAALAAIVAAYGFGTFITRATCWNLAISFNAAILIGALWLKPDREIGRLLSFAPLASVGRLTYAVYLTHVLVANVCVMAFQKLHFSPHWAVSFSFAYLASLAAAYVLHRLVEKPLIAVGRATASRPPRSIGSAAPDHADGAA
ncbi:acyltransferase [Mesorhizobium sp. M0894]|uniref:acyltransferase family protein n=1 Tax=unclassified Mesorhizobium TaxID=325217 RepID=UPI0033350F72